jgi:hypothetical protein
VLWALTGLKAGIVLTTFLFCNRSDTCQH